MICSGRKKEAGKYPFRLKQADISNQLSEFNTGNDWLEISFSSMLLSQSLVDLNYGCAHQSLSGLFQGFYS